MIYIPQIKAIIIRQILGIMSPRVHAMNADNEHINMVVMIHVILFFICDSFLWAYKFDLCASDPAMFPVPDTHFFCPAVDVCDCFFLILVFDLAS